MTTAAMARRPLGSLSLKALGFLFRLIWAVIVLFAVCVLWLLLFLLFLPFILVALLMQREATPPDSSGDVRREPITNESASDNAELEFIFDRRSDVSKLFGCNTRNVRYRWQVFSAHLQQLRNKNTDLRALDFGAGSLRDSYELAKLGFAVTSVDLNQRLMDRYFESYDWSSVPQAPILFASPLDELAQQPVNSGFHLAIAFDVIEHLDDPAVYVRDIHSLLGEDGLFFTIVPNRRSIFERYFKYTLRKQRERGIVPEPGVPHVQFKSPQEWRLFFTQNGFDILDHDMAIGSFVNDWWNGLVTVPLRMYVSPTLQMLAYLGGTHFPEGSFEQGFCPRWLMERVNFWDQRLKSRMHNQFGWNLIVMRRASETPVTGSGGFPQESDSKGRQVVDGSGPTQEAIRGSL